MRGGNNKEKRALFVAVGTTAVENYQYLADLVPELLERFGDANAKHVVDRMAERPDDIEDLKAALLDAHHRFWSQGDAYRRDPLNVRKSSAEMMSSYLALRAGLLLGGDLRKGTDRVILMASDTVIGKLCAEINESLIRRHLYFDGAGTQDVKIETIAGLNFGEENERPFRPYRQLELLLLSELMIEDDSGSWTSNGVHAAFNITGGYKGLIPAITHLAWSKRYRERSRLLYLHDSNRQTVILEPDSDGGGMRETVWDNKRQSLWISAG